MRFQNILVPYDDSECSLRAFKIATEVAKKFNSKLTAVTVILEFYHTRSLYANVRYEEILLKKLRGSAKNALSKIRTNAKKQGIDVAIDVLESNSVVKQIASIAKSKKIDLIIMGTHGRTGLYKLILGSVANGVSQRVSCPVLIVR
ncbi:MAG: UspA domain-containing protein [Marine Group I thaumarchaeote]|nr:MAG: UspA domain-containing protein [Marine Group I thaumarchaeote]